ncbi:hypothetical protein PGT21_013794 [Puccinia graminis f. sp. tritici]|uniref:Uncharacterized protein n=1 Tax=Puccinia graminis f. sp. tritici TaxID=56615 RepID=A0A5B0R0P6_PUCGR|nr:hypothetical protein PGT21_013794 [Puccinia graminis f. sp. tritici]
MPQHASRQRRSKIQDRGVPQTVSQLTAGLTSTSFFTPIQPSPDPPTSSATLPNPRSSSGNIQTAPSPNPNSSPPTPTAPEVLPASPSLSPTSPSVTNAPATHVPSSVTSTLPQASPNSEPPLHVPAANDNMVLAGSALPQNPPISASPQLSASHEVHNSRKPGPTLSTKTMANDSSSPNYIEALVVVGVIITVLMGGIFYYYFKVHRKKTKADHESRSYGTDDSSFNDVKIRSESISSSSHRIDKKTIVKVKSNTQSIMSFGPGPDPQFTRPPLSTVQSSSDVHHNYLPRLEKNQLSEKHVYEYDSSKQLDAQSKNGSQTTLYSVGDEVSHIPISYKASKKPAAAPSTLTSEAIMKPYPHLMVSKKASPKRYNRISKAARKLVPARLVTGVGIGRSKDLVPPLPSPHDKYQSSFIPKPFKSKASTHNLHSVYRPDDNYPTNFSYYQS